MSIYTTEQIIGAAGTDLISLGSGPMAIIGNSEDEIVIFIGDAKPSASFIGLPVNLVRGITANTASQLWVRSNGRDSQRIVIYNLPATTVSATMPPLGFAVLI